MSVSTASSERNGYTRILVRGGGGRLRGGGASAWQLRDDDTPWGVSVRLGPERTPERKQRRSIARGSEKEAPLSANQDGFAAVAVCRRESLEMSSAPLPALLFSIPGGAD